MFAKENLSTSGSPDSTIVTGGDEVNIYSAMKGKSITSLEAIVEKRIAGQRAQELVEYPEET